MLEWRVIEEFPKYEINSIGEIRNKKRQNKIKKPFLSEKGYLKVKLYKQTGVAYQRRIHRLVAIAFIPNPYNKPEVNHKNGIKVDCTVDNLEWVTGEENYLHAVKMGLHTSVKNVKLQ